MSRKKPGDDHREARRFGRAERDRSSCMARETRDSHRRSRRCAPPALRFGPAGDDDRCHVFVSSCASPRGWARRRQRPRSSGRETGVEPRRRVPGSVPAHSRARHDREPAFQEDRLQPRCSFPRWVGFPWMSAKRGNVETRSNGASTSETSIPIASSSRPAAISRLSPAAYRAGRQVHLPPRGRCQRAGGRRAEILLCRSTAGLSWAMSVACV